VTFPPLPEPKHVLDLATVEGCMKHAMKVTEKIFEHRIRQQTETDDMQFGFMKGKGTTDAIFMARRMQENFRGTGK